MTLLQVRTNGTKALMVLRRAEMHEGEDEEMMRVVSNGTRLRVPLTLAH